MLSLEFGFSFFTQAAARLGERAGFQQNSPIRRL